MKLYSEHGPRANISTIAIEEKLNGVDFFTGIAGLTLALEPWVVPAVYVEKSDFCQRVLAQLQADGHIPKAPIWDDIRTFSALPCDIMYGGFPCQDLSNASRGRGKGITGPESGLWDEMRRCIADSRPSYVFVENINAPRKWVPTVRRDLHKLGYTSVSVRVSADYVGAPFPGYRIFVTATNCNRESVSTFYEKVAIVCPSPESCRADWGNPSPRALGVDDGLPRRMDRLEAVGNAVVPLQARAAFVEGLWRLSANV